MKRYRLALALGSIIGAPAALANQPVTIEPSKLLEDRIQASETREYQLSLQAGQYTKVKLTMKDVAATISVFDPSGKQAFEFKMSMGFDTTAEWIAAESGFHRIRIAAGNPPAPPGTYSLLLEEVAEATAIHRERAAAALLSAQAQGRWSTHKRDDVLEAAKILESTLPHWQAAKAPREQAVTLFSVAMAYAETGEGEKAMHAATRALPLAWASQDPGTKAWALDYLGAVHNRFGDKRKAIAFLQQALTRMRAAADRAGEGDVLNTLGMAHAWTGQPRKAIEYFDAAVLVFESLNNLTMAANLANNMGVTYGDLGEYHRALEHYQRALRLHRQLGNRVGEANTNNNMGTAYSSMADYQKALDSFRTAMEIHGSMGRKWDVAINLHNIAWVHSNLGDRRRARTFYEDALAILRDTRDQLGLSNTLNSLGDLSYEAGDWKKALEYHNEALSLRRSVGTRDGEATSLANVAKVYAGLGQTEKAKESLDQAITLIRATNNQRRLAATLRQAGSFSRKTRQYEQATGRLNEALEISRAIHDRRNEAETLAELAHLKLDTGDVPAAHQRAGEALALIEFLRRTVASPNLRASFFAMAQEIQELDIALLMRLHAAQPDRGFAAAALGGSEHRRARTLLESLGESAAEIRRGADEKLIARERELEQFISAKAERRTRLLNQKSAGPEAAEAAKELAGLTAELEAVQGRIRVNSPQYAALTQPVPLNLSEIQQKVLDNETALLEFSLGAEKSFLFAVTASSAEVFHLPPRADIEKAATGVYELLTARNRNGGNESAAARAERIRVADRAYYPAAARLSQMLLGQASAMIANKRLLIVADGALQYLPFSALPEPSPNHAESAAAPPMILNHEIVTAPSASVMAVLRQESAGRKPASKTLAVLADPVFSTGDARVDAALLPAANRSASADFVRLRFSRVEAEQIARMTPPETTLKALDFDANRETALAPDLGQYRIVHFATHSIIDNERPELSGIVLSRLDKTGRPRNGFLRLYDIYNLRLSAELVVLSACETALGGEMKGEGLIGLTRGFLYAGTPRVVATLWNIDDRTTAEMMRQFYEAMLRRGERPAEALRSAQTGLWQRKGWEAPYYWAGFTIHGEWQ